MDQNSSSRREAGAEAGIAPRLSELGHAHVAGAAPQAATDAAIPGCRLHDPHHCGYSIPCAHLRLLSLQAQQRAQRRGFGCGVEWLRHGRCGAPDLLIQKRQWCACSYSEASVVAYLQLQ